MEKLHRCKRSFGNGRALGGHMRSHVITTSSDRQESDDSDADFHSSSSEMDQEFYTTETEHPKKQRTLFTRPNNKRLKNTDENSSASSISDETPEEQVARSLMMLSRDNWNRELGFEYEEGDSDAVVVKPKGMRGKYRCDECNKIFKSYQALGGHVASHKKIRAHAPSSKPEEKVHRCPFCRRVFSSGQALGGHKRSHFIGGSGEIVRNSLKVEAVIIDLNLPAPVDDEEISQVEVSDVC